MDPIPAIPQTDPPTLSYQAAAEIVRPRIDRFALGCLIAAAILYTGLVAFGRFVVAAAYKRMLISSIGPLPPGLYERYSQLKAIAVTIFLTLLATLATAGVCCIISLVRHPRSRRRATWTLLGCGAVLLAIACIS